MGSPLVLLTILLLTVHIQCNFYIKISDCASVHFAQSCPEKNTHKNPHKEEEKIEIIGDLITDLSQSEFYDRRFDIIEGDLLIRKSGKEYCGVNSFFDLEEGGKTILLKLKLRTNIDDLNDVYFRCGFQVLESSQKEENGDMHGRERNLMLV